MTDSGIKSICSASAPAPIGPYSQAVSSGRLVFVSGQIPIDPSTGEVLGGDIRKEAALVIDNIENILSAAGTGLDSVVKVEVFLSDIENFSAVNEVYAARFTGEVKPARSVIQASKLPKGARVEMSCIAIKP